MSIEEATVSKMWEVAAIVELLERKGLCMSPQKKGTSMDVIDRIILSSIAIGIWAWVLVTFLSGKHIDC
jgi:hypothetical protein